MKPKPTAVRFRVALAVATVLAAFSTLMSYQLGVRDRPTPYGHLAALNGFYWYAWALMAPLIVALAQRFRFERDRWRRALAVHILGALLFAEAHILAQELFRRAITSPAARNAAASFWWGVRRSMIQYLDWEMMTYWAIVGMTFAVAYQREAQERAMRAAKLETKLVETQLQTLQSQLHPHFLFNTLHAISALMHSNVNEAERMLTRLGELLRMTLDNVGQQEVPLKEELDFLERYLQIEQTRFRDRLTITFDVQPETLDALVPWMLLQPLVENAIKHGISPRPGPGTIQIRSRGSEGRLLLEVIDDGMGLSQDGLTALQSGIGLSTTRQRLNHLFRNDYQFEFHRRPRGLTVRVVLPWRTQAAPAAARTA